ncbi:MAG: hypothetical protein ACE1ZH_02840, partial [Gammaproteobacteria bacterium]
MTNINETSPEPDEEESLNKPNTLLREHQGESSVTTDADSTTTSFPVQTQVLDDIPEQVSPSLADDIPTLTNTVFLSPVNQVQPPAVDAIPTLTEKVFLSPEILPLQSEITPLLRQILDATLKETGTNLDAKTQESLISVLEQHLRSFCLFPNQNKLKAVVQPQVSADETSVPSDII